MNAMAQNQRGANRGSGPLVSLVIVTKRPAFLPLIMEMMRRQDYAAFEIVTCLHGIRATALDRPAAEALQLSHHVLEMPETLSLGYCLNAAIAQAQGEFIAKIDDDDIYGSAYLSEAVQNLLEGKGAVVGKAEHYVYLQKTGQFVLRRAGESNQLRKFVHGATLVFPRSLAVSLPFQNLRCGEDTAFLQSCLEIGLRVYSGSRRNYIYMRRGDEASHTWTAPDAFFFEQGIPLRTRPGLQSHELLKLIET